jgi:hypothetical protein
MFFHNRYHLKDRKLRSRAKGDSAQILMELNIVWNEVIFLELVVFSVIFQNKISYLPDSSRNSNSATKRKQIHRARYEIQSPEIRAQCDTDQSCHDGCDRDDEIYRVSFNTNYST